MHFLVAAGGRRRQLPERADLGDLQGIVLAGLDRRRDADLLPILAGRGEDRAADGHADHVAAGHRVKFVPVARASCGFTDQIAELEAVDVADEFLGSARAAAAGQHVERLARDAAGRWSRGSSSVSPFCPACRR